MCVARERARAHVGNPQLDRTQAAAPQPVSMRANLLPGLQLTPSSSVTCNRPNLIMKAERRRRAARLDRFGLG